MMTCQNCGQDYEEGLAVCPECGRKVEVQPELQDQEQEIKEALKKAKGILD